MTQVVAIGDVHGCYDLLVDAVKPHLNTEVELIFLGDLFDRGPNDFGVLKYVRNLQDHPEDYGLTGVTVLRGNHEQMLIDAIKTGYIEHWEQNGGNIDFLPVAAQHLDWLDTLPLYAVRGHYLFVHAGVMPGVPLNKQEKDDLLWIRAPFLSANDHELPYTVIHGHSPIRDGEPDVNPHRINIDTGAFFTGKLTAYPITL